MNQHDDIRAFHEKFGLQTAQVPSYLTEDLFRFRLQFMQEELDEFAEAHENDSLINAADGLIDLVYVAQGTALLMGLPWMHLWKTVHTANMQKVRALRIEDSKRGSKYDIIKPKGWTPPDHSIILGNGPWPIFDPEKS